MVFYTPIFKNLYFEWESNPQILDPKSSAYTSSATEALEVRLGFEPRNPGYKAGVLTIETIRPWGLIQVRTESLSATNLRANH